MPQAGRKLTTVAQRTTCCSQQHCCCCTACHSDLVQATPRLTVQHAQMHLGVEAKWHTEFSKLCLLQPSCALQLLNLICWLAHGACTCKTPRLHTVPVSLLHTDILGWPQSAVTTISSADACANRIGPLRALAALCRCPPRALPALCCCGDSKRLCCCRC